MKIIDEYYLALELIKHDAKAFEYISDRLKNNKEFMLKAIEIKADSFQYTSEELRDNNDLIEKISIRDSHVLKYLAKNYKKIRIVKDVLEDASDELKIDIIKLLIKNASDELKTTIIKNMLIK